MNRIGWGRLCRILTQGKLRSPKGECSLSINDLCNDTVGLLLAVVPSSLDEKIGRVLLTLLEAATGAVWLAAAMSRRGSDHRRLVQLKAIAAEARIPLLAINDALYHVPERRPLQDVMSCIREKTTIESAGRRLEANAERHLKSSQEMTRLFREAPDAVSETLSFLGRIHFSLDELRYE